MAWKTLDDSATASDLASVFGFVTLLAAAEKSAWNKLDELEKIKANPRHIDELRDVHATICEALKETRAVGYKPAA